MLNTIFDFINHRQAPPCAPISFENQYTHRLLRHRVGKTQMQYGYSDGWLHLPIDLLIALGATLGQINRSLIHCSHHTGSYPLPPTAVALRRWCFWLPTATLDRLHTWVTCLEWPTSIRSGDEWVVALTFQLLPAIIRPRRLRPWNDPRAIITSSPLEWPSGNYWYLCPSGTTLGQL